MVGSAAKTSEKRTKRKINTKRIFISSMPGAGSMWTCNIARELIRSAGLQPIPQSVPIDIMPVIHKAFTEPIGENQVYCVKTHYSIDLKRDDTLIITTYRDIRDAVLSFMKFMHVSFEEAFKRLQDWMKFMDTYFENQSPNILKIRYDDIVSQPMDIIRKIDRFIGTGASFETMEEINERFSKKNIKEKVDSLKGISVEQAQANAADFDTVRNADGSYRVFDRATGFQTSHITSQQDGQWREELTEDQKQRLMNETADWLERHGFEL